MSQYEDQFNTLADILATKSNVSRGQMFGKPCIKVNGKAFAAFHQDEMAFKLSGEMHKKALAFKNAHLWDPSGKGRPMKEWVCVPNSDALTWKELAESAQSYVTKLSAEQ